MQRIEVDCQSGEVRIFALTSGEEATLETERREREKQQLAEDKKSAKRLLILHLAELREMRLNRDVFDDADLVEKQGEIDALKSRLTSGNP